MEYIYGILASQYCFAIVYLVLDIRRVLATRVCSGTQVMMTFVSWVPFLPVFVLVRILLEKMENKILPKMWILPPKKQKM